MVVLDKNKTKKNLLRNNNLNIILKRLFLVLFMVGIPIFNFTFQIAQKNETVSTMSLPVTNKTIIVDAGHGGEDGGASGKSGINEAEINLRIALKLQNLLEQSESTVILTRSDENAIYELDKKTLRNKKISDTRNRVKIGNESSADIFVSIHLNKIKETQYYGWQTFYKNGNEKGLLLAESIQENLNNSIKKENKRVPLKISNIYIIKYVEIPTVIVECGFLSNEEEEKQLLTDEYQDKLAWGIYNGIMDYFNKSE